MTKTANVVARVEPTIKNKAESILAGIGIPVSTLINALYRQIIYTNGIPFSLKVPNGIQSYELMTEEELREEIETGYKEAVNGEGVPLDEAIESIRKEIK